MTNIRSFLAIELPPPLLSKIAELQDRLRRGRGDVRWVRTNRIHLTLKFFGNIEEEQIVDISSVMAETAAQTDSFALAVRGLGAFPSIRKPRVIWLGVAGGEKSLLPLQQKLETRLEAVGFSLEEKRYRPHLTIGRVKSLKGKGNLVDLIEREKDVDFGSFVVDRMVLLKSDLRPTGPVYIPLVVRELAGG